MDNPWLYLNSRSAYVATASWEAWEKVEGRPGRITTVRQVSAESDSLPALEAWARRQQTESGAARAIVHRTWPIEGRHAPTGHRLHGKRENAFLRSIEP